MMLYLREERVPLNFGWWLCSLPRRGVPREQPIYFRKGQAALVPSGPTYFDSAEQARQAGIAAGFEVQFPEESMKHTLKCSCGKYEADFDSEGIAESAAKMHVMLGKDHVVTCTRPAHFHAGGVPVVVFTAKHKEADHE